MGEKLLDFQIDAGGRFDVPVPFGDVLYRVIAEPTIADLNRAVLPEAKAALGDVGYSFGVSEQIKGTVVDEKGAPAAGVTGVALR